MSKPIYLSRSTTEAFKFWKTYNRYQPEKERIRDIKNNYPIICPIPASSEIRFDCLTDKGYFYEMKNLKGNCIGIIIVAHTGILKLYSVEDEFYNIKL